MALGSASPPGPAATVSLTLANILSERQLKTLGGRAVAQVLLPYPRSAYNNVSIKYDFKCDRI